MRFCRAALLVMLTVLLAGITAQPAGASDFSITEYTPIGGAVVVTESGALEEIYAFEEQVWGQGAGNREVVTRVPIDVGFKVRDIAIVDSGWGYRLLAEDHTVWALRRDSSRVPASVELLLDGAKVQRLPQLTNDDLYPLRDGGWTGLEQLAPPADMDLPAALDILIPELGPVRSGLAVNPDGSISSWGFNGHGLLSVPKAVQNAHIVELDQCVDWTMPLPSSFVLARDITGGVHTWAPTYDYGYLSLPLSLSARVEGRNENIDQWRHTSGGRCVALDAGGHIQLLKADGSTTAMAQPNLPGDDAIAILSNSEGWSSIFGAHPGTMRNPNGRPYVRLTAVSDQGRLVVWENNIWDAELSDIHVSDATTGERVIASATASYGWWMSSSGRPEMGALTLLDDPVIIGTPVEGETLTVEHGDFTIKPVTEAKYQWLRDGEPIEGATDATYVLTADDVGREITVEVTGHIDPDDSTLGGDVHQESWSIWSVQPNTSAATASIGAAPVEAAEGPLPNAPGAVLDSGAGPGAAADAGTPQDDSKSSKNSLRNDRSRADDSSAQGDRSAAPDEPEADEESAPEPPSEPEPPPDSPPEPPEQSSPPTDSHEQAPDNQDRDSPPDQQDQYQASGNSPDDPGSDPQLRPDSTNELRLAQLRAERPVGTADQIAAATPFVSNNQWWWLVPSGTGLLCLLGFACWIAFDTLRRRSRDAQLNPGRLAQSTGSARHIPMITAQPYAVAAPYAQHPAPRSNSTSTPQGAPFG